ncbi:hypothetical protein GLOIN_2v1509100 [Rhizophagus irregularis DAOM 181602=DAOM 197198]|uniref:Uncharacterized protein n=1 Tax=Rhizophagus irregularis (strain DAOM 181602 / DAOM 197198 / MUCL 43194) TaxID=747089 RepID=A0A2P4QUG9_RHIID|nr:hypothetical protein GLOIN_2v1509100 [Rhizophagus irregularis DAOM 181602=DAOM 197198]POG81262.1 hypothetical protein GLOIN_2v1509100 [Rhizophagus irregularis DAOM 181602=DAOM 197198]GET53034.1 hypothetical protein GLOIN_2v1509100 [Rhizophagus irregularis DAOM 181602=DAOM 197198]|eukprot:XP_025188128.1 hypothetical protein GLOIN_2v1509100 [Rhizophagus irregularis DAOM 181602=DAOM 197198]
MEVLMHPISNSVHRKKTTQHAVRLPVRLGLQRQVLSIRFLMCLSENFHPQQSQTYLLIIYSNLAIYSNFMRFY